MSFFSNLSVIFRTIACDAKTGVDIITSKNSIKTNKEEKKQNKNPNQSSTNEDDRNEDDRNDPHFGERDWDIFIFFLIGTSSDSAHIPFKGTFKEVKKELLRKLIYMYKDNVHTEEEKKTFLDSFIAKIRPLNRDDVVFYNVSKTDFREIISKNEEVKEPEEEQPDEEVKEPEEEQPDEEPEPEVKPEQEPEPEDNFVYVKADGSGRIYHKAFCPGMKHSNVSENPKYTRMSLNEALKCGYKPCKNCSRGNPEPDVDI